MPRTDFVCAPTLRVRWAEVDMQKIVFNGHYLTYIDTAIAEYWREHPPTREEQQQHATLEPQRRPRRRGGRWVH